MNLNNYGRSCGILQAQVGNITEWVWPAQDTQTFPIIVHDWFNGIRPVLQERFPTKGRNVIQAGGNCGVYPLLYTEFFNNVYTFEPDPLSFFCLVSNCQMPGIVKFNCALGDGPGTVVMNEVMPENRGMNKVDHDSTLLHTIPVIAIDGLGLQDIDLIQFDIEGYENKALMGAADTIKRNKPLIIVESAINNDAEAYKVVEGILRDMSYSPLKQITRLDTVFVPD